MDAIVRRNSRWTRAPARGARQAAQLSAHDVAIFEVLARYRYLSADYIHALVGGSFKYLTHRLGILSREPNLFLVRPAQQRANAAANHRYLIYELDQRGIREMQERGLALQRPRPPASFAHELMACHILASFELGARQPGIRLITWTDILGSRNLPETTRRSARPFHIPIRFEGTDAHAVADAQPFGIERLIGGQRSYYFCPGIEADCGTEPIETSDFERSSIFRKFTLYRAIQEQGLHRTHFGFPNFHVPFVTTNAVRLASMMRLLERTTEGAGSRYILFKTFPAFTSFEKPLPPSGHMLTEDWQRVGYSPFNFLTS
ncbi:MAG TPA: hypothetical protein VMF32_22395 [Xanthobacteraceae bacterium]|nr:hypothetical protein [Xanthobacteraceae bacterium]